MRTSTVLFSRLKRPISKLGLVFGLLVISFVAWAGIAHSSVASAAADSCTPPATTYGTDTMSVSIPATGTYTIWVRMQAPSASSTSILLNIDNGQQCYNAGGSSSMPTGSWTWVNYNDGSSNNVMTASLSQGTHTFELIGTQSGMQIDRIEALSDNTCTPTGTGDNCTVANNTAPTAAITAPANNATVSGTTTVTATATPTTSGATITSVQFKIDGQNVGTADTTAPYNYSWNTTSATNGNHTITAVATDSNGLTGTASTVTANVSNVVAPTCTAGSSTLPTTPTLSKTTTTYTSIGLQWTTSTPSPGCTIKSYTVLRNGQQVASVTSGTTYTDTGLTAGTTYAYTVKAVDSGPNTSQSGTANFTTTADNLAPSVPTGVTATAASTSQVNLAWTTSTDNPNPGGSGVAGYNIYRNSSTTPLNGASPVVGTRYDDTTATASTHYTYTVTAVDVAGNESAPSTVASATTPAPTCSGNPTQPGTPTAGTRTVTSVAFSWTASTASAGCTLSGYHVYQVNGSTYTLLSTVTSGTSTTLSSLTPNTSYTLAVEAYDSSGHTSDKTQAAAHITIATLPDTTAPSAPGSVTATAASSSQVNLSWVASTDNIGVTGYNIYRCSGSSCTNFTLLTSTTGNTIHTYNDTSVAASTSYTYQVSALDSAGNESTKTNSSSVTTPAATGTMPAAPTSARAPVVATQSANLAWTAPSGTITGYHVYINGVLDTYSNDTFTATGGTLSCLAPSVTYTVTVKAYNGAGEGPAATVSVPTTSGGLAGDFNCDLSVNGFDLNALATNWNATKNMQPYLGDANGDTAVNGFDLNALATNWNKSQ